MKKPRAAPGWAGAQVRALGHSTRALADFVAILRGHGVKTLADIRKIPRSRHNPQFNPEQLAPALARAKIRYIAISELGGRRSGGDPEGPNAAWRNRSFRAYADHLQTDEAQRGLRRLKALATRGPVALMCAEAVPWRCHRTLVADALFALGVVVQHLDSPARAHPHRLTPFARLDGRRVTYPAKTKAPAARADRGPIRSNRAAVTASATGGPARPAGRPGRRPATRTSGSGRSRGRSQP
jgi:hypothetical protein